MPTAMPGMPYFAITGCIAPSTARLIALCRPSAAWLTAMVAHMAKARVAMRALSDFEPTIPTHTHLPTPPPHTPPTPHPPHSPPHPPNHTYPPPSPPLISHSD